MLKFLTGYAKWIMTGFGVLVFGATQMDVFKTNRILQKIEGSLIDSRYLLRGEQPANPNIVLLGVQSSSLSLDTLWPEEIEASEALKLMQKPWPWDREVHAMILERLMAAGAKVVVFDFVYSGSTPGDAVFAEALKKYQDRVAIGATFYSTVRSGNIIEKVYRGPEPTLIPENSRIVGLVSVWPDVDGVVRRARYQTTHLLEAGIELEGDNEILSTLSVLAVEKFGLKPRISSYDSTFVDFHGGTKVYEILPVENIFVQKLWEAPPYNGGEVFRDKIVIVGPTAEIFQDRHNTPFGVLPGPTVQANLTATLLEDSALIASTSLFNFLLTLAMIVIATVICIFIRDALIKGVLLLGISGALYAIGQSAFIQGRTVIALVPPLLGLWATGVLGIGFRYFIEQFEKQRIRVVLEKYVSRNVAKAILNDPRSFVESMRGKKQQVTVLFCDIRGFTTMTESRDPDELVAQLNEYFGEMVEIIQENYRGTLQKYIGDAIMAVWGDTHTEGISVDARLAVSAALNMRPALRKLNEQLWRERPDRNHLSIGIGINHGEVIVGNIGHPQRMEFTVLGDGVNLAARLESSTKQFHTDILIGEEAEKLTRDDFIYRKVGAIAFKGKTKPIEVYFLLSDRSEPPPPWLETYHEAIALYRKRCFGPAIVQFEAVHKEIGGDDYLCRMYLERCAMCLKMPPPDNWDGSFTLTEK